MKSDLILDYGLIQKIIITCGLEHEANAEETPTVLFLVMFMSLQLAKFIDILKVPLQKAIFFIHLLLVHFDCYMDANFTNSGLLQYPQILFLWSLALTNFCFHILWSSKLQNENAIEYIGMSQVIRDLSLIHALFLEFVGITKWIVGDSITHSTIDTILILCWMWWYQNPVDWYNTIGRHFYQASSSSCFSSSFTLKVTL